MDLNNSSLKSSTSEIKVNYKGFSEDEYGAKAQQAIEYAATIWERWIQSDVAIEVDAHWLNLDKKYNVPGVLAAASPYSFKRNFDGATEDNTYYAISLANHLAGKDLNGDTAEIETEFNSKFGKQFYFGTDGDTPTNKYDFVTIVLHEFVHGFGLTDYIYYYDNNTRDKKEDDGASYGKTIFESFIINSNNQNLSTFAGNSKELVKQLTSKSLFFNGANAVEANNGEKVKLYAPSRWEYGSSIAHLDEKTYPKGGTNSLMTPRLGKGEAIHNPGAITLGILEDLGWDINEVEIPATPQPEIPATPQPETPTTSQSETPVTQANAIKFEQENITAYAGQDKDSILNISDNNQELTIAGNGWKKLAFDYKVTEKTILEFEFKSDVIGEIQAIGFETDDKLKGSDKKRAFQLEGIHKFGISDFKEDITGQGWKTYQITVGDYFQGDFNYLTFINDHDVKNPDAKSQYRNLRIYEEGQQLPPVEPPVTPPAETPVTPPAEVPATPPAETPVTQANFINFEQDKITSYAGQDKDSILNISDNNQELAIEGNGWKKLAFDYQVTEKTILEFEFRSDVIGEIQAIGFETDDKLKGSDKKRIFQLEGTDNYGIKDFKNKITGQGWKTYQITVGDYFKGDFNYLTFINDHDNGKKNAVSQYRNLRIYEEGQQLPPAETPVTPPAETPATPPAETPVTQANFINFEQDKITSYAGQDKDSVLNISDNNQQLEIAGNGWKKLAFDYQVTEKTILEFEFRSDVIGEIQAIGFETDDKLKGSDKKRIFQLEGTDNYGIKDFKNKITGQGWKTYQITVGDYFQGDFNYLTFINDHDKSPKNAKSQYRNLKLYEGNDSKFSQANIDDNSDVVLTVNDSTNNYTLSSYGGQNQDKGISTISDNKTEIKILGNSWQKLDIDNYNITNNTVLKFDFQSQTEAEIQGIGFDNDDIISGGDENHLFQIAGTQNWGIELEDDYTLGSGWKTYEIKVGEYMNGEFNYLTLANDHDISNSTAESQFRNISLSEM